MNAEQRRLEQAHQRTANWKRWGPCLAERQWGTVREDFHGDHGRGLGASHQTGWTALAATLLEDLTP